MFLQSGQQGHEKGHDMKSDFCDRAGVSREWTSVRATEKVLQRRAKEFHVLPGSWEYDKMISLRTYIT